MRRSVWVCVCTAVGVLAASVSLKAVAGRDDIMRYHQHLSQPSEADLGPCESCPSDGLCTHLPIIEIETGGQKVPGRAVAAADGTLAGYETGPNGEEEVLVRLSTVEEEGVWHHPSDEAALQGTAWLRVRGNSSRWFSKSSYRVRLVEQDAPQQEARLPLLGMDAGCEWALYGPFLDKTLIRNYMWMNLSAEVTGYAPNVRFCEVMLDGAYQGLYVLMETITVPGGEERLSLTQYRDGDPVCSYLLRIEPYTNPEKEVDNFTFYTGRMEPNTRMELVYPGIRHQNAQVRAYVQTDINEIEKQLYCVQMMNGLGDYRRDVDITSFVDYYILQEFLSINDAFSASTYFHRDVRGKLCAGPVWDFNNALNNFIVPMPEEGFLLSTRGWFSQLMCDRTFVERVISRYRELRRGKLSQERLLRYIDETESWLGGAVERNFQVWGDSFDPNNLTSRERRRPETGSTQTLRDVNPASVEEAVKWMKDYMVGRGNWMDEHIEALRQYCHPSKNAVWTLG